MKIRKGDSVLILTGKDNGKTGIIESVDSKHNKVIISGLNLVKRHRKPSTRFPQGGIIDVSQPIAISNVEIICGHCKKITKPEIKIINKQKQRICRNCKEVI